jgi:hypothetical protein
MTHKEFDDQMSVMCEEIEQLKDQLNKTNSSLATSYNNNVYKIENNYEKKFDESIREQYNNVEKMVERDNEYFTPKKWFNKKQHIGPPNPRPTPKPLSYPPEESEGIIGTILIDEEKIILVREGEEVALGKIGDFEEIAKNLSVYIAKKMLERVK